MRRSAITLAAISSLALAGMLACAEKPQAEADQMEIDGDYQAAGDVKRPEPAGPAPFPAEPHPWTAGEDTAGVSMLMDTDARDLERVAELRDEPVAFPDEPRQR